jgi:hypothetical protein
MHAATSWVSSEHARWAIARHGQPRRPRAGAPIRFAIVPTRRSTLHKGESDAAGTGAGPTDARSVWLSTGTALPAAPVGLVCGCSCPPSWRGGGSAPLQQMIKLRPLGHVHDRLVPALQAAREAELDGAPAVECVLDPRPRRLGGQWLGVPSPAWTTWAAGGVRGDRAAGAGHPPAAVPGRRSARPRTGAEGLAGARVGEVDGARALAGRRPLLAVGRPVRGPVHTPARRCLGYRAAR